MFLDFMKEAKNSKIKVINPAFLKFNKLRDPMETTCMPKGEKESQKIGASLEK